MRYDDYFTATEDESGNMRYDYYFTATPDEREYIEKYLDKVVEETWNRINFNFRKKNNFFLKKNTHFLKLASIYYQKKEK